MNDAKTQRSIKTVTRETLRLRALVAVTYPKKY